MTANARGRAGAVAHGAPEADVVLRKPARQACQQRPGHGRRRLLPPARHTIPGWGTGPGAQDGTGPGSWRDRQGDEPRPNHPRVAPALGRSAVGRPHPLTRPSLATHVRARRPGDGRVACPHHRPRRHPRVQQEGAQGARRCPRRPAARGPPAMRGPPRSIRLRAHGAQPGGDSASPRGQPGGAHQDGSPGLRRGRKRGSNRAEDRHGTRGDVHVSGLSRGVAAGCLRKLPTAISPSKVTFANPLTGRRG